MRAPCASRRSVTAGTRLTRLTGSTRPFATYRRTPDWLCSCAYFDQVAATVVPFITDHLLSPALMRLKQFAFDPFQVVQKPSLLNFQVPSPLAPDFARGSRVILPSGVNTILNFTFEGVEEVKGWPLKKVA